MTLYDDSVERLRARVAGFHTDIDRWVERTDRPNDLGKHRSQLVRLRDYLDGTLGTVVGGTPVDPAAGRPFAGSVDDIPRLRRGVGSVHLLWDFFRDKLAQRDLAAYAPHLAAADDLAWAVYEPFLAVSARTDVREPPLIFYSTDRTPFAQARTRTLHPPGLDAKDLKIFETALQRLPVPVIGIPWDVANRMPETALVGHEAGHVVAEDLGLAAEARAAITAATFPDDTGGVRKAVWLSWCDEVLADVIGVLATGSAYVEGLTAELAGALAEIRLWPVSTATPGRYPTPALRVAFCEELLGRVGVPASSAWRDTYGPIVGNSREYAGDVPVVAAALLDHEMATAGGRRLAEVLPWDPQRERDAHTVGTKALAGAPVPVPYDVRLWVAGAMHAYRTDPAGYTARKLDAALAKAVADRRTAGVRGGRESAPARDLHRADREAGARLARELGLA